MKAFLQTKGLFKLLRATYTEPQLLIAAQIITYNNVDTLAAEVAGYRDKLTFMPNGRTTMSGF